jgi:hypothetical protein
VICPVAGQDQYRCYGGTDQHSLPSRDGPRSCRFARTGVFGCVQSCFFFQLAPFLVLPTFIRLSFPSTLFLVCTLFDFNFLLSTALSLSCSSGFGLSAFFRRQPLLLQCSAYICAELFDP